MNILGILGKVVGAVLPTVGKEKAKLEAVDTLISKKTNAGPVEVCMAIGYKYLRLALYFYIVYNVIQGNVSFGELLKALAINIAG